LVKIKTYILPHSKTPHSKTLNFHDQKSLYINLPQKIKASPLSVPSEPGFAVTNNFGHIQIRREFTK
jgi:hypothetical protein